MPEEHLRPMSVLALVEGDEHNFRIACDAARPAADLVEAVLDLYALLGTYPKKSTVGDPARTVLSAAFLLSCQYELTLATATCMRGRLADSMQNLRRAIEFCAFAGLTHRKLSAPV